MGKTIESAGIHATIDAFVEDPSVFNIKKLTSLFGELASTLEMEILKGPEFVEVVINPKILRKAQETGEFHDEGGLTGFCVISQSHISCHAWPLQSFFSMDLFSCGEYDYRIAVNMIFERLGVKSASLNIIERKKHLKAKIASYVFENKPFVLP